MIELDNKDALTAQLQDLATQILAVAKQRGATAAEVNIDKGTGLSTEVRMGEVEKLEYHRDQGAGITVYFGNRKGYSSCGDLSVQALTDAVDAACRIAKYTAEDEFNGLADAALMAKSWPDLDLYHPWELDAETAINRAKETEAIARETDARITNSDGSSVESYAGLSLYTNSHGFCGTVHSTHHSASCVLVGQDGDSMQRDYWYSVARSPYELESPDLIGRKAAERTLRRLNARTLSTCEVPVLFPATLARGLIGSLVSAVTGGAQYRKATFLLNAMGQKLFPDFVQLREDPFIPRALGSRGFDGEGVATQARDILVDGVLQGYFLSTYSAKKLGMVTTGNAGGNHNLILQSTGQSFEDLLQQLGTGLLLNELFGGGVNGMTGDYSRGAVGFWVENGVIQYPVEEITIAGNLKDMYHGIQAIGNDVDMRGNIRSGSILINRMTIAGSN
ncbi:MAG: metalloprotease PmbA [Thiofilum sp.]|uniref:metalloprotease PmbA n=1 Tax=Thiofilum sp. TaxID=2212733 RepID=UPI0025D49524|nr:metalloprotease PmbA [Thiofilum sp.]MBK8453738.1 metalloprotease PmbA [Thiofilum sp.]